MNTPQSRFQNIAPDIFLSLVNIHKLIDEYGIDRNLTHLIMLRASQINQCGYCVEMHTREAREDGETNERLDGIVVFRQMSCFNKKEKLTLEWTEILTHLNPKEDYKKLHNKLLEIYTVKEISTLTALIGMINIWNRIRISEH